MPLCVMSTCVMPLCVMPTCVISLALYIHALCLYAFCLFTLCLFALCPLVLYHLRYANMRYASLHFVCLRYSFLHYAYLCYITCLMPTCVMPQCILSIYVMLFCVQTRSQALSPLPPFVVGKKTLVAAGHVTTQNLGGKKICWAGGVAEIFYCCCGKLCRFQNIEHSLKTIHSIGVRSRILRMKNATLFLPSSKI